MKKVLALVLVAIMALSLATVASAITIEPGTTTSTPITAVDDGYNFGDDAYEIVMAPGTSFVAGSTKTGEFLLNDGAATNPDKYTVSATATSSNAAILKASVVATKGKASATDPQETVKLVLKLEPAKEYFTVEDHKVTVKLVVIQKKSDTTTPAVKYEEEFKDIVVSNKVHDTDEFFADADGKVVSIGELSNPVITAEVFTETAKDKALTLDYGKYTVKFAKVSKQNTALYLKASTSVAEGSKAIASIGFKPTRVKDAATITMPINPDNQNFYGETVYVYSVVDGKPTGEAIAAEVVNHNSVIFTVPAGTTLGTFAAYGAQTEGEAEKPAIPETGANDIVNIAIVFAVVALAAAGFVAVKKASK